MRAHLQVPTDLRRSLLAAGFEEADPGTAPSVIATGAVAGDWPGTLEQLTAVYRAARSAAIAGHPIVFVLPADGLLGRLGPTEAMAATGIVSAARTLAAELRKDGVAVNALATATDTPGETIARWAQILLIGGRSGPTGELIQLGGVQIGKALS